MFIFNYRLIAFILLLCVSLSGNAQNVGIGTTSPNATAILDLTSSSQGLLVPRMSTAQRLGIVSPARGLLICDTTGSTRFYLYDGTTWNELTTGSSGPWVRSAPNVTLNTTTDSVGIGVASPTSRLDVNGNMNIGSGFVYRIGGQPAMSFRNSSITSGSLTGGSNTGQSNIFLGHFCGNANTTGEFNIMIGHTVGGANTTASNNLFIGNGNGNANTTGINNIFIGNGSGASNVSSNNNTFIGFTSGELTTGADNVYLGKEAGRFTTTADKNVIIGSGLARWGGTGDNNVMMGYSLNGTYLMGSFNTYLGVDAGANDTGGTNNVIIGSSAGFSQRTGTNNTLIGPSADVGSGTLTNATALGNGATVTASNTMVFGNGSVTKWGFGTNASSGNILQFSNTTASLTTGGTWTNASDRNLKENTVPVNPHDILKKVMELQISEWNYKNEHDTVKHIGPMAQDFYSVFRLGNSNKSISTIDPAGIALAAIQALKQQLDTHQLLLMENNETKAKLQLAEERYRMLEQRLMQLEQQLNSKPVNK